jgi:hypothetical protein
MRRGRRPDVEERPQEGAEDKVPQIEGERRQEDGDRTRAGGGEPQRGELERTREDER